MQCVSTLSTRIGFMLLLLFGLVQGIVAAEVSVQIDRSEIHADESFTLVFTSHEELQASPDFKPIERMFDILNQNSGSSLKIINGRRSYTQSWTLTLMPRAGGDFTIPSIDFGGVRSDPLKVRILPARNAGTTQTDADVILEVEADAEQVYVQGQLILTLRIKHAVPLAGGSLSEPELSDADAILERLGEDRNFETRIGGRPFSIIERRYAIFPQHSGTLTIEPIRLDAQLALSSRRAFDPFQRTQQRRFSARRLSVEVLPMAADFAGRDWLPAQSLQLVEQWPEHEAKQWRAGEPITRTLAIMADGLTPAQLPPIEVEVPDGIKAYPDQPVQNQQVGDQGLIAIRQEKVALIPTHAGSYTLPAVKLRWWNVASGREEVAELPAREVAVLPAVQQPAAAIEPGGQGREPRVGMGQSSTEGARFPAEGGGGESAQLWMGLSGLFALLWLTTLLLWWRSGRSRRVERADDDARALSLRQQRKALHAACHRGDAAAARPLLLALGESLWPQDPPATLREVALRCGGRMPEAVEALDAALYAPHGGAWQGERLWQAIEQCAAGVPVAEHEEELTTLYPE